MIKAVIVKENTILKIVVAKDMDSIPLNSGEKKYEIRESIGTRVGDKFEGFWSSVIRKLKLKK